MTLVQNQEITMPENVGYITELILSYCYKASATLYWGQLVWICVCLILYLTFREMCSCELLLLCVMVMYLPWLSCAFGTVVCQTQPEMHICALVEALTLHTQIWSLLITYFKIFAYKIFHVSIHKEEEERHTHTHKERPNTYLQSMILMRLADKESEWHDTHKLNKVKINKIQWKPRTVSLVIICWYILQSNNHPHIAGRHAT